MINLVELNHDQIDYFQLIENERLFQFNENMIIEV